MKINVHFAEYTLKYPCGCEVTLAKLPLAGKVTRFKTCDKHETELDEAKKAMKK